MKKITLKITTFLLLTMFVLQVQGQIVLGDLYTLRNAATGNYMGAGNLGGVGSPTIMTPTATYTTAGQNFKFVTSLDPAYTNISPQDTNGTLRQASFAVLNTAAAAPTSAGDRKWVLEAVDVTDPAFMYYRFKYSTSSRRIMEVVELDANADGNRYLLTDVDPTLDDRSLWVVQPATIDPPLSAKEFDTSSIFISNPVNNQLSIKGLPSNVKQVSVYSLLGQEVLTKKVDGQSSLNIDVSPLTSGMYLVEMKGDNGVFTKKIVKE